MWLFSSASPGADILRQVFNVQPCAPMAFWLTNRGVEAVTGKGRGHPSAPASRVQGGHLAQPGLFLKPVGGPPKTEVALAKHSSSSSSFVLQDP